MPNYPTRIDQPLELAIGPFVVGEIPLPLVVIMEDRHGHPIALDGATDVATWRFGRINEGEVGMRSGSASVTDGTEGEITYEWQDGDLSLSGIYHGVMWVQRDGRHLASQAFVFQVYHPPYPAP